MMTLLENDYVRIESSVINQRRKHFTFTSWIIMMFTMNTVNKLISELWNSDEKKFIRAFLIKPKNKSSFFICHSNMKDSHVCSLPTLYAVWCMVYHFNLSLYVFVSSSFSKNIISFLLWHEWIRQFHRIWKFSQKPRISIATEEWMSISLNISPFKKKKKKLEQNEPNVSIKLFYLILISILAMQIQSVCKERWIEWSNRG